MITENEINFDSYIKEISDRQISYAENVAYIMPEGNSDGLDILNEYSPDLRKDLKEFGINSVVVKGEKHTYQALRSADIILPLILGIPFSVLANFLTDWLKKNIKKDKTVSVKFIKKDGEKYKKINIEGSVEDVEKIINSLKEH
ncbi:hypothetical protein PEC301645_06150 [Pectobacterium carotovorum subsp. carotovorum]|uniref:hypothetical protein n=1 Tax=Pectobacterium carotovorum TaxID=554 RepID=UPI002081F142|nr:hypothetical protein [Pectobacterium carotovorum]GKV93168.1 hypothetical protein PEC301645_06150 [Pectobacterium carotovorum subsp. carotovorum]